MIRQYVCELKSSNKIWVRCDKKSFNLGLRQFFDYCSFATKKDGIGLNAIYDHRF